MVQIFSHQVNQTYGIARQNDSNFYTKTYRKSLKGLRHTIKLRDAGLTAPMKPNKVTKKSNLQDKRCVTKGQNDS